MMATADIIDLILRDESIHGVYVGMLGQQKYKKLTPKQQKLADKLTYELLDDLVVNETKYTHDIFGQINLAGEVIEFVKYNANKALMNLGKEEYYKGVKINPIVQAGIDTATKTHDFFSKKGNGYIKAVIEDLEDEDFNF
jgi:ribonucleoside-diphosphate reductase beta chain